MTLASMKKILHLAFRCTFSYTVCFETRDPANAQFRISVIIDPLCIQVFYVCDGQLPYDVTSEKKAANTHSHC